VVIHVIAEQATIDGTGDAPGSMVEADGLISPELLQELAKSAKLVPLVHPGDAPPECGYTPSRALADYVRCRDLTCRFPGCDRPALGCDLDHTIPYGDGGRTHASNMKCPCRLHHLLKTFLGWRDKQLRDGTIVWVWRHHFAEGRTVGGLVSGRGRLSRKYVSFNHPGDGPWLLHGPKMADPVYRYRRCAREAGDAVDSLAHCSLGQRPKDLRQRAAQ
jgi:hypothetical protein